MTERPKLIALKKTCDASPSQWEGKTLDGKFIYIRYRWYTLSYGIGNTLDAAVENSMLLENEIEVEDESVFMTYAAMSCIVGDVFDFQYIDELVDARHYNVNIETIIGLSN